MSSFQELSSELTGRLPGLSPFLADSFIVRAWKDVRDSRLWSFLQEDCGVVCPTQVVAGTVNITQFSPTVVADATASAALLAIPLPPPLTLTALQIRFGGTGGAAQVGQLYQIAAVDTTNPNAIVITLDRILVQVSNPTAGYQCYRAYFFPPVQDFLRWESIVDMTNGWYLRLNYTSTSFDRRDPQRQAQGLSYFVGSFKGMNELQTPPKYELWPHPTSGQQFYCRYRRSGADFTSPADLLPPLIPDDLVMERALGYHAYPWAAGNVGIFPQLRGANWAQLSLDSKQMYQQALLRAKRNDDEQELQTVFNRGHGLQHGAAGNFKGLYNYPIDSNFIQSHLVQI